MKGPLGKMCINIYTFNYNGFFKIKLNSQTHPYKNKVNEYTTTDFKDTDNKVFANLLMFILASAYFYQIISSQSKCISTKASMCVS